MSAVVNQNLLAALKDLLGTIRHDETGHCLHCGRDNAGYLELPCSDDCPGQIARVAIAAAESAPAADPVELSACCHAEISYDAWVDSNGILNGGPFDNCICTNCCMEEPAVWDGKSLPWPRDQREGNADLPEGVSEPSEESQS